MRQSCGVRLPPASVQATSGGKPAGRRSNRLAAAQSLGQFLAAGAPSAASRRRRTPARSLRAAAPRGRPAGRAGRRATPAGRPAACGRACRLPRAPATGAARRLRRRGPSDTRSTPARQRSASGHERPPPRARVASPVGEAARHARPVCTSNSCMICSITGVSFDQHEQRAAPGDQQHDQRIDERQADRPAAAG